MKKAVAVLTMLMLAPMGAFAADEDLKARIQALEAKQAELYHSLGERRAGEGVMSKISEKVSMHGTIEVDAGFVSDDRDGNSSDLVLSTVELGFEAEVNERVKGHVLFLYEEDDTPFDVDEGTITLTAPYGLSLTAGKMYVPFGKYETHFISDPMTLELGETNETALLLAYGNDTFDVSVGAFNGDADVAGDDNRIDDFVASLNIKPAEGISFGVSYLSDIADSDADLGSAFTSYSSDGSILSQYRDKVGGYSAYASLSFGKFTLEGEYLTAADDFNAADIATAAANGVNIKSKPSAWNVELEFAVSDAYQVAAKMEGSDDIDDLPENKYGAAVSWGMYEGTTLAAEYMRSEYKGEEKGDAFTVELAIEF